MPRKYTAAKVDVSAMSWPVIRWVLHQLAMNKRAHIAARREIRFELSKTDSLTVDDLPRLSSTSAWMRNEREAREHEGRLRLEPL